jgi:hypothetical protein
MKLTIILEKGQDELWGRIENVPHYLPVTCGETLNEVENNLIGLLDDYIQHEGKAYDEWRSLNLSDFTFNYVNDPDAVEI